MPNLVALLFGAAIVLFYSYERFNRVTYQGGRQLERLVNLLSPDKLRARRIVVHAYAFYALILLLIYFFLCAYAKLLPLVGGPDLAVGASKLPVLPVDGAASVTTGFTAGDDSAAIPWTQPLSSAAVPDVTRNFDIGIDPSISLTIALIMVGLAPTFPILRSFEDWMRGAAHRLAGIPTRVLGAGEDLRRRDLAITAVSNGQKPGNVLLIPQSSRDRMDHYRKAAKKSRLSESEDFRHDLELIFAVSTWILDRKLKLANAPARERFDQLEEVLRKRRDQLILELDDKSAFQLGSANETQDAASGDEQGIGERKRVTWERLAKDAQNLADDLCILLALYVEHEIIVTSQTVADEATAHQHTLAKKELEKFLVDLLNPQSSTSYQRSFATMTSLWVLGVVLFVSLFWSLLPGRFEHELAWATAGSVYSRTLIIILYAFNNYCIPMIVTLALRDAAMQSRRWQNMRQAYWTSGLPQAVFLVFVSWAVAAVFAVGLTVWKTGFDTNWTANEQSLGVVLQRSFEYNAPTAFRGALLALIVVVLLDAWRAQARSLRLQPTYLSSVTWASCTAVIMALCGGFTRYLTSWATKPTAQSLDAIDRGLIVYSALFSALIGFFVVFCIAEALLNQRSGTERLRWTKTSSRAPKPTPAE